MTNKFLLYVGIAFAIFGFGLVFNSMVCPSTMIDRVMSPGSFWRAAFGFALFSGAVHLLFVGLRSSSDGIFWCAPIAFCEAMMGMTLVGNAIPFSESSPAGSAAFGFVMIGLPLFVNGLTMIIRDGYRAHNPQLAIG